MSCTFFLLLSGCSRIVFFSEKNRSFETNRELSRKKSPKGVRFFAKKEKEVYTTGIVSFYEKIFPIPSIHHEYPLHPPLPLGMMVDTFTWIAYQSCSIERAHFRWLRRRDSIRIRSAHRRAVCSDPQRSRHLQ